MTMQLRPYQQAAVDAVRLGWATHRRQLGVAATGAGKTIIFSHLAAGETGRTLILAHRDELVGQAVAKLHSATGICASVEAGASRAMPGHAVIVASVQSMRRRLDKYNPTAFDLVICDEAHHALSNEWQTVLSHFESARVLGVTATPDRSDRRELGGYFQSLAFEIGLLELIGARHLCGLRGLPLKVELDARHLKVRREISADEAADIISPRLQELARAVASEIWDRKSLIFLPRCDISELFAVALSRQGIDARHVAGASSDRVEQLQRFQSAQRGSALCNAMLLTEGYDQPDIDCVVILRPIKSRGLLMQTIGRGLRTWPGKEFCLAIDPMWIMGDHDLCRVADLVAPNPLHRAKLQSHLDAGLDLVEAETRAKVDVEAALALQIKEALKKKKAPRGLVDPLAWAVGIHDSNLAEYEPAMPWEDEPPTDAQLVALKRWGVWAERMTRGYAVVLLERIEQRDAMGLATPKQVDVLRRFKVANAETMSAKEAGRWMQKLITRKGRH